MSNEGIVDCVELMVIAAEGHDLEITSYYVPTDDALLKDAAFMDMFAEGDDLTAGPTAASKKVDAALDQLKSRVPTSTYRPSDNKFDLEVPEGCRVVGRRMRYELLWA